MAVRPLLIVGVDGRPAARHPLGAAAELAAAALGPVIGGYLTTVATWWWVFAVNVPIGIVGSCSPCGSSATSGSVRPARWTGAPSDWPRSRRC